MTKMLRMSKAEYDKLNARKVESIVKFDDGFPPGESKYKNKKTATHASRGETKRSNELKLMERSGMITDLKEQVKFTLIPSQVRSDGAKERPVTYTADFTYLRGSTLVVEDFKGFRTQQYVLRRKLMLWIHGISVMEV